MNADGRVVAEQEREVAIGAYGRVNFPVVIELPQEKGGYLLTTFFKPTGQSDELKSRRYIRIGSQEKVEFPSINP